MIGSLPGGQEPSLRHLDDNTHHLVDSGAIVTGPGDNGGIDFLLLTH